MSRSPSRCRRAFTITFASICSRSDVKLDDIVCEQIERWLLRQTITRLEAPEEDKDSSTGGRTSG